MRFRVAFLGLSFLLAAAEVWPAEKTAREIYDQLNALRVDPATLYDIEPANRIELRRGDVQLSFEQGKLAFLQLFEGRATGRSEEHTSELQSRSDLVCRLLLEKK